MSDRRIGNDLDFQGAQRVKNALDGVAPQDYATVAQLPASGGTVTSVGSSDLSITVANPTTTPDLVIAVVDGGSA